MIDMDPIAPEVSCATIFEDKCSEHPRAVFRGDVMKTFEEHHANARTPELVSFAAALMEKSGVDGSAAVRAAARVLDQAYVRDRAAVPSTDKDDCQARRAGLVHG